jgi:hypothetical protein
MRTFTTLALGLIGAAVASASDVSSLTKDTFPDFIKENDLVLAECKPLATCPLGAFSISTRANISLYSLRSTSVLIPHIR